MTSLTKLLLPAVLLVGLLAGCGDEPQPTASGKGPGKEAQLKLERTDFKTGGAADDFEYLHSHLWDLGQDGCSGARWAGGTTGDCTGRFLDGTKPFSGGRGSSRWRHYTAKNAPSRAKSIPSVFPDGIVIQQADNDTGKIVECYIADRGSGDCYTDASQEDKPPGTIGGPMSLDVHSSFGDFYVFVRGFCRKDDALCTPHRG